MSTEFRCITKEEMNNNIFRYKDFPVVFGLSSKYYIDKVGYYGLFIKDKLIAIAHIKFTKDNICKLKAIEVKQYYQKKGYGKELLSKLEEVARNKKCKEIILVPRDYRVFDFYKKCGYEYIHEHLMKKIL